MTDIISKLDDSVSRNPYLIAIGKTDKHELLDALKLPRKTRFNNFRYKGVKIIQVDVSSRNGEYRLYQERHSCYKFERVKK
jgi:hypothetical protein